MSREEGFTLLELLVVIAIMGLVIGLVAMRGGDRAAQMRLPEAAATLAGDLRLARLEAIRRGELVRFAPPKFAKIAISGSREILFSPEGSASAGEFDLSDGARRLRIRVEPLTGRVEVENAPGG